MHALLLTLTLIVLTQATQATHMAEEWVNQAFQDLKEEESKHLTAQKSQALTDKKLKETFIKLAEYNKARRSAESAIERSERQAQEQLAQLKVAESQLSIARSTIVKLKKELSQKAKDMDKVE